MLKKGDSYYPSAAFKKKAWINDNKIYKEAAKDPVAFWEKFAKEMYWQKPWRVAFEHKPPYISWFAGGKLNITENVLEENLKKNADKAAIVWQPEPIEEQAVVLTYEQLATG